MRVPVFPCWSVGFARRHAWSVHGAHLYLRLFLVASLRFTSNTGLVQGKNKGNMGLDLFRHLTFLRSNFKFLPHAPLLDWAKLVDIGVVRPPPLRAWDSDSDGGDGDGGGEGEDPEE